MIKTLNEFLKTKKYFVFDFDRTLAKMEIDWSGWYSGIAEVYSKYDPNHGFEYGKNPHEYHNSLVEKHGESLLFDARKFNQNYEIEHLTGFTPNKELVEFIQKNSATFYVYSSNAKTTVMRGLTDLDILNKIEKVVSKDDVTFVKPNPEGFSLFSGFQDNKPLFLMIGDSSADKQAAKAADVDFLECNVFNKYVDEE